MLNKVYFGVTGDATVVVELERNQIAIAAGDKNGDPETYLLIIRVPAEAVEVVEVPGAIDREVIFA